MITRRNALLFGAGCLIYLVALIATTPAPWVSHFVERLSRQVLLLREPVGTVWTGRGRLYARQQSGHLVDLGVLRWNSLRSGIVSGYLAMDVVLSEGASRFLLELSPASTTVRRMNVELPAGVLARIVPELEAFGPQGKLQFLSENMQLESNSMLGLAEVVWRSVRLARAPELNFGSHVARLRGDGSKIEIELVTIDGPLRINGNGTWNADRGLVVSGTIEHGEDQSAAFAPFFQIVCGNYVNRRCEFRVAQ